MPTPLDSHEFRRLLTGYDQSKAQRIFRGIHYGFDIGFEGQYACTSCENSPLINQYSQETRKLIEKEIAAGRVEGPFENPPFKHFHLSPLTIRPKPTPGEYRLIHNLSAPYDFRAVNEGIPDSKKTVKYESIVTIISKVLELGKNAYMAKSDVKSAFRLVPVHPKCYHLLGFQFEGKYYFDKCLVMGGGSSCEIFELISTGVNWILRNKFGIFNSFHYLDDFIFMEDSEEKCRYDLEVFQVVCKRLGVVLSPEKTEGPKTSICFLGILLDSEQMSAKIPHDKLVKYRDMLKVFMDSEVVTQAQVKSLVGCLNWCTSIVTTGRAFLRRLLDLALGDHVPTKIIALDSEVKRDIRLWLYFLNAFNGRVFLDFMPIETSETLEFYTDASFAGAGGTFGRKWFQIVYPHHWMQKKITYLELYPVVVAIHLFGEQLSGKKVIFHTDNYAVMSMLNKCTSPNKKFMPLIRAFVLQIMKFRIKFCSRYVKGILNVKADAISRFQVSGPFLADHGLELFKTPIPKQWFPLQWDQLEKNF